MAQVGQKKQIQVQTEFRERVLELQQLLYRWVDMIHFNHQPTNTVNVEVWNGTSWTEVANLAQSATNTQAASITSTSTIKMGGYSGPPDIYYTATEEWASGPTAATVTTS